MKIYEVNVLAPCCSALFVFQAIRINPSSAGRFQHASRSFYPFIVPSLVDLGGSALAKKYMIRTQPESFLLNPHEARLSKEHLLLHRGLFFALVVKVISYAFTGSKLNNNTCTVHFATLQLCASRLIVSDWFCVMMVKFCCKGFTALCHPLPIY